MPVKHILEYPSFTCAGKDARVNYNVCGGQWSQVDGTLLRRKKKRLNHSYPYTRAEVTNSSPTPLLVKECAMSWAPVVVGSATSCSRKWDDLRVCDIFVLKDYNYSKSFSNNVHCPITHQYYLLFYNFGLNWEVGSRTCFLDVSERLHWALIAR